MADCGLYWTLCVCDACVFSHHCETGNSGQLFALSTGTTRGPMTKQLDFESKAAKLSVCPSVAFIWDPLKSTFKVMVLFIPGRCWNSPLCLFYGMLARSWCWRPGPSLPSQMGAKKRKLIISGFFLIHKGLRSVAANSVCNDLNAYGTIILWIYGKFLSLGCGGQKKTRDRKAKHIHTSGKAWSVRWTRLMARHCFYGRDGQLGSRALALRWVFHMLWSSTNIKHPACKTASSASCLTCIGDAGSSPSRSISCQEMPRCLIWSLTSCHHDDHPASVLKAV